MIRLHKPACIALLSSVAWLGAAAIPAIAAADDDHGGRYHNARQTDRYYRDRHDHARDTHDRTRTDVRIDINLGRPRYEPVYEERTTRVWVEPVYRTVCERVWIEPVYRKELDRVWVPDRWEYRDVVHRDRHGHRVIRRQRVLVERGHWDTIERSVLACEGYFKTVERQELVSPGHWEYRTERVQVGERRGHGNPFVQLFADLHR
jgi:hypothetical protein